MPPESDRPQRLRRRTLALFLGLVLALAGFEGGYRLLRTPAQGPTTNPTYVLHDDTLGWCYRPNARVRHATPEFDVGIEINARGFRGAEWPASASARPCVLVLGDSFAFGWGVAGGEVASARVAESHPEWDVRNAAVSGYGTDQELLLMRSLRAELAPRVVVCFYCANDLREVSSDTAYGKHKPHFEREAGVLVLRGVPVQEGWLERCSQAWRGLMKGVRERNAERARRDDPEREWGLVCDLYRTMRDELAGVPLLIVSEEARLANLAREERGIAHLDLRPLHATRQGDWTYPVDGHWTPRAQAAIAEELGRALVELVGAKPPR